MLNNSGSKGNKTMKLDQLLEYNMGNIFLRKSYTKCGRETISRPFSKESNLSISHDQGSKILYSLFLLTVQIEGYQNILKTSCQPLAFTAY